MDEAILYLLLSIGIFGFIAFALVQSKNGRTEKLLTMLTHEYGLPIPNGIGVVAHGLGGSTGDNIRFVYLKDKKDNDLTIPINNIIAVESFYQYELEKGNLVGRAIVGGILAGGIGSIIGIMTTSEKQKEHKFLYIKYRDNNGEKELLFTGKNYMDSYVDQFIKLVNDRIKFVTE